MAEKKKDKVFKKCYLEYAVYSGAALSGIVQLYLEYLWGVFRLTQFACEFLAKQTIELRCSGVKENENVGLRTVF